MVDTKKALHTLILMLTSNPGRFKRLFKKFCVSVEIVFYILKYYLEKIFYFYWFKIKNDQYRIELKSFFFIIIFSFFLYYFIVIELSILLFGYSLLCYWFLFIFLVVCILVAWWLEAEFIKNEIDYDLQIPIQNWIEYYNYRSPLSFSDYITNYKNKPLFRLFIINWYKTDIEDGRLALFTFFSFLIFFFLYSCFYRFDPRFVKFVAKYFFPVVNFFETRWNPRLEDFISATVRFWNWIVSYLEATRSPDATSLKIIKKLPKPSSRLDDEANLQRSHKISLWKNTRFSDIFFLWAVKLNPELWRLVFDLESPVITGIWFDPNWKIFFLRYITGLSDKKKNFWLWYFQNDQIFWQFITNFWDELNLDVDRVNNQVKNYYQNNNTFVNTSYDLFLSENYFSDFPFTNNPYFQWFGSNRDLYQNLIYNTKVNKNNNSTIMKEIFTSTAYQNKAPSLTELFRHNKKLTNSITFATKLNNKIKLNTEAAQTIMLTLEQHDYKNFVLSFFFDLNLPLYWFSNFENFDMIKPEKLGNILSKPITTDQLLILFHWYNYRLSALENQIGLYEWGFSFRPTDPLTLPYITSKIEWRLKRLDNFCKKEGFFNFLYGEIPALEELKFLWRKYLKLSNFTTTVDKKNLMGSLLPKESEKIRKIKKKKLIFQVPTKHDILYFIKIETKLRVLEWQFNLRTDKIDLPQTTNLPLKTYEFYPWYMWSLKYFSENEHWFVLPGFVWYYVPTPYPSTFTTFGFSWIKYQFFRKNVSSTLVGQSDSIAEIKNSTPIALYSGVEAIIYIKPFLQIFDFFVKYFIKIITYPIEYITTQTVFPPLNSIFTLAFSVHLIWFLHFYIYFFLAIYVLYYIFLYYNWKIGFLWFYEWMFDENFFSTYNNWIYWHSVNDIWLNYKTPEQLYNFAIHTNLLLHYTFFNYVQFFYVSKNNIRPMINFLIKLNNINSKLKEYVYFSKILTFSINNPSKNSAMLIFWSFYNIRVNKYIYLLFSGGFNCSVDHLIWSYLDYLSHFSNFISRSLWKNSFKLNNLTELNSLIKQFTILISSTSLDTNYLFLSNPLTDTVLSWKLLINLFNILNDTLNLKNNYFLNLEMDKNLISYILFSGYKFDFFNKYLNSGFDVHSIFENKQLYFLSKLNNINFWDSKKYWLIIFFWSFWFVPKIKFPHVNLHSSYETTRLQLSRIAYSNSWIGQSMYTRPFFNLIQHLWWTSKIHSRTFGLINTNLNLNSSGLNILDNVRNFYEKRHPYSNNKKIETIFGFVWSLNINSTFYVEKYGEIPLVNKNFDLSFPNNSITKQTTNRSYLKTNPPLDLCELGLTPYYFLQFFKNLNLNYYRFYLSFLAQIELIDSTFTLVDRNLNTEFLPLTIYEGLTTQFEHTLYSKYEFYFKKFDFELKYDNKNPLSNWIFTFDTSYFFSHFLTWDNFSSSSLDNWKKQFNLTESSFDSETTNLFFNNFEMLAKLTVEENWFKKPFGVLDKYELHTMKKFKTIKILDKNSFSRQWEDPFLNLDKEHTLTNVGLMSYPKQDNKNLSQTYNEEFSGYWQKRFPYNPTIIKNAISLITLGWVGEIYNNTKDITSFLYSLSYATTELNVSNKIEDNYLENQNLLLGGKYNNIETFFIKNSYNKELLARAFTWVNLMLAPTAYWYTFGQKSSARFDYWSWKCGFTIDYWNGLYLYRPYLGFRHSFYIKLLPYDSLYGFYSTFWQSDDNPLIMDLSTSAIDIFKPKDDEEVIQNIKDSEKSTDPDYFNFKVDTATLKEFSIPYRELYYSFHHPYFLGYLLFWTLIFSTTDYYLGLVNFSFKWFLLKEFLLNNTIYTLTYETLSLPRNLIENWFRKQMYKYRIYYSNPIYLLSIFDCIIDDEILEPIDDKNTMHKYFLLNLHLFSFFSSGFNFTSHDIIFLLDFKKIYNYSFLTNWLTLDIPFSLNPYLVFSHHTGYLNTKTQFDFYRTNIASFSHYDSLKENYNYNLFFDWSTGTYLDTINLISYMSCFRGNSAVPSAFYDNPAFIASSILRFPTDKSIEIAKDLQFTWVMFYNHDLPMFAELALHNFSIIEFFQESIEFFVTFNANFFERKWIFEFLKFYFKNSYFNDFNKYNVTGLTEIDSKIATIAIKKTSKLKQIFFLYKLFSTFSYDLLLNWLTVGVFFNNWSRLLCFFNSLKLWLFSRYSSLQKFYFRLGISISFFFFKKN